MSDTRDILRFPTAQDAQAFVAREKAANPPRRPDHVGERVQALIDRGQLPADFGTTQQPRFDAIGTDVIRLPDDALAKDAALATATPIRQTLRDSDSAVTREDPGDPVPAKVDAAEEAEPIEGAKEAGVEAGGR